MAALLDQVFLPSVDKFSDFVTANPLSEAIYTCPCHHLTTFFLVKVNIKTLIHSQ
ncbi:hypothetical protein AVDCRST_MAG92-366 [uncultured Coleofasciculus sp.]|uniref:Uncharacterized protein n=1 Tax=uncultured Coleofasciculus sp. TaxID=1267456 RepID=A0A6J4H7P5_9CYAN|nr:hypothetical protein AVDCRST_MAG92-366 [uncultured Coleofasciculus sp.]